MFLKWSTCMQSFMDIIPFSREEQINLVRLKSIYEFFLFAKEKFANFYT